MIEVEALDAPSGAVVRGVDLRDELSASTEAITELWVECGLLVFPGQHLSPGEQDTFARRFGDVEFTATPLTTLRRDGTLRTDPDDHFLRSLQGNEGWHLDSTYLPPPAKGAVFTGEIVPRVGGAIGFADMRAAYDALDDETRGRVGGLLPTIPVATAWSAPATTSPTTWPTSCSATASTSRRSARR